METYWRCDCSSETKCPDCAERRRKLLARLIDLGTSDQLASGRHTYFLTLTAPGEAPHRRWVQVGPPGVGARSLPADRPECECWRQLTDDPDRVLTPGEVARVLDGVPLAGARGLRGDWNSQESACWNRLRTSLSRLVEGNLTYIGSVEVQKRGMLHRHIVLSADRPLTAAEVGHLAVAAGYGCTHDLQPILSASKAAWYISKYVTKGADRDLVPWRSDVVTESVDRTTGELTTVVERLETTPTYRTWSSARSWGYTLSGLRAIARAQAAAREKYLRELADALELAERDTTAPAASHTGTADPP